MYDHKLDSLIDEKMYFEKVRDYKLFRLKSLVEEKRRLLNFVFQNLKLEFRNLSIKTCEPFTILMDY